MREVVCTRLYERFNAWQSLADSLTDDQVEERAPNAGHKNLREHLWCVVGARESYARALAVGSFAGFACSMQRYDAASFQQALSTSAAELKAAIEAVDDWTSARDDLLAELAEHEVMHEGQVIRHLIALDRDPSGFAWA